MERHFLNIGEYKASRQALSIECVGLGSCIGLFLYDRVNKVGGGAHIFLPGQDEKGSTAYAYNAFKTLIQEMLLLGANIHTLRAKIIGGANIYQSSMNMGEKNREAVRKILLQHKVYLASEDTGGQKSRNASFFLPNGQVKVSTEKQEYFI